MAESDPKFVDYFPTTCTGAIALFYKLRDNGHIKWDDIDVPLRQCAHDLNEEEYKQFLAWVLDPCSIQNSNLVKDPIPSDCIAPQGRDLDDEKRERPEWSDQTPESGSTDNCIRKSNGCTSPSPEKQEVLSQQ